MIHFDKIIRVLNLWILMSSVHTFKAESLMNLVIFLDNSRAFYKNKLLERYFYSRNFLTLQNLRNKKSPKYEPGLIMDVLTLQQ